MINSDLYLNDKWRESEKKAMRDGYGEAIVEEAAINEKIMVLVADLIESMRLSEFQRMYPERLVEMGIAEQNMVGVASGMAMTGLIPVVNSFAVFNPGRNWEQIRVSVAMNGVNVKIVGGHAGFGNGFDGANQQAFEDVALMRVIPGMKVVVPADYEQAKKALAEIVREDGPVYLRITKPKREVVTTKLTPFSLGRAQVFRVGKGVTVFACGQMVAEALKAAEILANRVDVEVINIHTIKPIDKEAIVRSAKKTGRVVVAEEHSVIGGLGEAVAQVLADECPTRMRMVGMSDMFGESGEVDELMEKYNMTSSAIVDKIEELIKL